MLSTSLNKTFPSFLLIFILLGPNTIIPILMLSKTLTGRLINDYERGGWNVCVCVKATFNFQVAEMHGELMEFNELLHRQLNVKELHLRQLRQELVELRGPVRRLYRARYIKLIYY